MISFPILERNCLNFSLSPIEEQGKSKNGVVQLPNSIQKIDELQNNQKTTQQKTTKRIRSEIMSKLKILIPTSRSLDIKSLEQQKQKTSESPLTDSSATLNKSFNSDTHENQKKKSWTMNLKQVTMQANQEKYETYSPFLLQGFGVSFEQKYQLLQKIGQGAHSSVYKCRNISTNQMVAVKIARNVDEQMRNMMMKQYKLLKVLDHPNVLKVYELIFNQDEEKMYIISQLCQYKDLRHQILRKREVGQIFSAGLIRQILLKILEAIQYLHNSGICHRDLKPQNILFNSQTKEIKIIDFQICSQKLLKSQNFVMWTNTGTLHYKAPQMFSLGYDQKVDIWSVGVILYELITGDIPFNSIYEKETIKKIKYQNLNMLKLTKKCSSRIKFLLIKMLQKTASLRFSSEQCLYFLQNQAKSFYEQNQFFSTPMGKVSNQKNWFDTQSLYKLYPGYRTKMDFIDWKISTISSHSNESK